MATHAREVEHRSDFWPRSRFYSGPYGRLFRELPSLERQPDGLDLENLPKRAPTKEVARGSRDEPTSGIPAGYTYFGQFIAHDITFNPVTDLTRRSDPESLVSFRTPRLDLDSLYGRGPIDSPYLYDPPEDVDKDGAKARRAGRLSVGWGFGRGEEDLPRTDGTPAVALIGDPRNDENTIISQLHLAFIKLHNRFFKDTGGDFELAQRLTCWHYQWVILHDYLFKICNKTVLNKIWPKSKRRDGIKPELQWFTWRDSPFIPLEFSGAAFRFGHSMVRKEYRLNYRRQTPIPVFGQSDPGNLMGFRRLQRRWTIQWDHFLKFDDMEASEPGLPQESGRIDLSLSPSLQTLPVEFLPVGAAQRGVAAMKDLRVRNIERGYQLRLPSGQDVARAIGCEGKDLLEPLGRGGDPLWVYILREADELEEGKCLGKVGSTIVAETIIGLVAGDPLSYLNVEPKWKPAAIESEWKANLPPKEDFNLSDLIRVAGMPISREHLEKIKAFSEGSYDPRESLLTEFQSIDAQVRAETQKAQGRW